MSPSMYMQSTEDILATSYTVSKTGCWIWSRNIRHDGYGSISRGKNKRIMAHRASYELAFGPIPDGLVIDHLCRTRACINPDHLEAVTNRTNLLRGIGFAAANAQKTHCAHGHPFDEANTAFIRTGGRKCRACDRIRKARKAVESEAQAAS